MIGNSYIFCPGLGKDRGTAKGDGGQKVEGYAKGHKKGAIQNEEKCQGITRALLERKISVENGKKIMGENLMRVFSQVWKNGHHDREHLCPGPRPAGTSRPSDEPEKDEPEKKGQPA